MVIAYACDPRRGSEEGVGWGWLRMIAAGRPVDVITAAFNAEATREAVEADPLLRDRVRVIAGPDGWGMYRPNRFWRFVEDSPLKFLMNLAYTRWLRRASQLAERLHAERRYELVHLVTYVGFRFPGRFYRLGCPFVWGPIGGLENTPWRFLPLMGWYGAVYYACRNVINTLQKWLLPGPKRAMRKAAEHGAVIAATEGIRREIKRWYGVESHVICEIGPPPEVATDYTRREPGEPLRIAWSGQHLPGKALPLLLDALVGWQAAWRLVVLGAGPYTRKWQRRAERLGIAERIEWTGQLPRDRAVRRLHDAHVFVITSLKDLTSTVLLEALAQGVPVVCLDYCGFSNVVTEQCGIKVPMHSPSQVVAGFRLALERLERDETVRRRLAAGALERIRDFSWEKKAEMLERIYRHALETAGKLPNTSPVSTGDGVQTEVSV